MTIKEAYVQGLKDGVWRFAWMNKDGTYFVGTCGKTYKQAIAEIEKEDDQLIDDE
jgi:hypothetical protein